MVCCQPAHKPRPGFHRTTEAAFGYGARGELPCTKKSERFDRALLRDTPPTCTLALVIAASDLQPDAAAT